MGLVGAWMKWYICKRWMASHVGALKTAGCTWFCTNSVSMSMRRWQLLWTVFSIFMVSIFLIRQNIFKATKAIVRCCLTHHLYINYLTSRAVWQHLLPGADPHAPLSTFFRLIAQVASDLRSGEVLNKPQRRLFRLIYYNLFLAEKKKETIAELWTHWVWATRWRNRHSTVFISIFIRPDSDTLAALSPPRTSGLRSTNWWFIKENHQGSYLDLFTPMLFFLSDKYSRIKWEPHSRGRYYRTFIVSNVLDMFIINFFFFVDRSDKDYGSSYEGRCVPQILQ